MENLFNAQGHVYNFVKALKESKPYRKEDGSLSKPFEDKEVQKHINLVKRECSA